MKSNILVFTAEPFHAYEEKGLTSWYPNYFNPDLYFDEVFITFPYHIKDERDEYGLKIRSIKFSRFQQKLKWHLLMLGIKAARLFKDKNIKVIRAYNTSSAGLAAIICGKLLNVPVVISIHNDNRKLYSSIYSNRIMVELAQIIEKFLLRRADNVWCVSQFLCDYVKDRGVNEENIKFTPNKIDTKQFEYDHNFRLLSRRELGIKEDEKAILFVGRFSKQKNIFTLLEAIKKLVKKNSNIKLFMVGDGELKPHAEKYIKQHSLEKHVNIVGFLKNNLLKKYYSASDCFVLPSFFEGFGVVLVEAQAAGKAIICSDIPAVKTIVSEDNSLLFNPNSSDELYLRLEELLSDPQKQKILEQKSKENAKRFDKVILEKKEVELYKKVIGDFESKNV